MSIAFIVDRTQMIKTKVRLLIDHRVSFHVTKYFYSHFITLKMYTMDGTLKMQPCEMVWSIEESFE